MKKLLLPILSAIICMMLSFSVFAAESIEIQMTVGEKVAYVNGEEKALDTEPIIRGNRTMLPVHFVAENLGATVAWDSESSTATVKTDKVEINITIGASVATVNGESVALDAPAFIENSRTYMPVRFVAEKLGATVAWDGETSTATITLGYVSLATNYTVKFPDFFDFVNTDLTPYVTLGEYKGLTIKGELPTAITSDDVEAYIDDLLSSNPEVKEVTDRAAKNGDIITVNFVGKIDGVAFEGGSASNYEITLGNGGFISGFEEGIIGMKIGETKAVETVFPADYGNADLAGKTAIFDITLLSISEEIPAEYTTAYVKENFGYETKKEFEAAIKAGLEAERNAEIAAKKEKLALEKVLSLSKEISVPEGLVYDQTYMQVSAIALSAAQYGLTYEQLLAYSGMTVEEYESLVIESASTTMANTFLLAAIAKAEGLVPTKEECDAAVLELVTSAGVSSIEEFCTITGYSESYLYNASAYTLMGDKALDFIVNNNTFKN